jgi:hypothetical protein
MSADGWARDPGYMAIDFDILRAAFREQSADFVDLVDATPDLGDSTELDGWDCAALVGHVSTAIEALWRWRGDPPDGALELDRGNWWDAADPTVVDDFAQRYASKRTHDELRELTAVACSRANGFLADASPTGRSWRPAVSSGRAWTRRSRLGTSNSRCTDSTWRRRRVRQPSRARPRSACRLRSWTAG